MLRRVSLIGALSFLGALSGVALAQPYPAQQPYPGQQPVPQVQEPYGVQDPYGQQQQPAYDPNYDPNQDYDPDIDGYDVQTDVRYDQQVAQNYDDGYDPNAYQQFESELSPYGQWVEDPTYGRVWSPSSSVVGADFMPYAAGGHWVLTDYGWTWVSDWNWGWAPFHYGRWTMCGGYGWCWIPGTHWGPAWVSWRTGGGYVGWAPMPPPGVTIGPPTGVRTPWRFAVASSLGGAHINFVASHVVPSIWGRTTVVANTRAVTVGGASVRFNAGPTLTHVTPVALSTVAPHAMPQPRIVPRVSTPVASRPWVQNAGMNRVSQTGHVGSIPIGPQHPVYSNPSTVTPRPITVPSGGYHPVQSAPHSMAPQPVYSHPSYSQPVYHAPAPAPVYHPTYAAPAPSYHYSAPAPSYHYSAPAPSYHYSAPAPSYSAPAPSYHYSAPAPSYHPSYSAPAPSYHSAPSSGRSFGGRR
jgi:hypothetical protein